MNTEEIDYWLRYFSNHNHGFMSGDGKKITLFKVFQELKELQQENQELKKQLEEKNKPQIFIDTQDIEERYAEGLYQDYLEEENKKYKNQQKEFIEYLENEKDRCLTFYSSAECMYAYDVFKDVLSKYNEIIDK